MTKIDMEIWLKSREMVRADGTKQPSRFVIAAHHEMLAVIDLLSRAFVNEGIRSPSKMLMPFEDEHGQSTRSEVGSGAQSAEPATYHDHIRFRHSSLGVRYSTLQALTSLVPSLIDRAR
jgi:hypothetical protein